MTMQDAVNALNDLSAYELAQLMHHAPVSLDSLTSPGAVFLSNVRDTVAEALTDDPTKLTDDPTKLTDDPTKLNSDEWQHEQADSATPIYTYEVWKTFIDLQGWETDHAAEVSGLTTESVQAVLYYIAGEVIHALVQQVQDQVAGYDSHDDTDWTDDLYEETPPNAGSAS